MAEELITLSRRINGKETLFLLEITESLHHVCGGWRTTRNCLDAQLKYISLQYKHTYL